MKLTSRCLFTVAALACGAGLSIAQDKPAPPPPPPPGGGSPGAPGGAGATDPRARFDEFFKKIDANGDGKISKEEYLEYTKKEAEERFARMDANHDGVVDKDEAQQFMQREIGRSGRQGGRRPEGEAGGTGTRPRPEGGQPGGPPGEGGPRFGGGAAGGGGGMFELIRKVRESGSVTKEEFEKMSAEQFDRLDTNHDGKITADELEGMMRRFGGGGGGMRRPEGEGGGVRGRPGNEGGGAPQRPESEAPKPETPKPSN